MTSTIAGTLRGSNQHKRAEIERRFALAMLRLESIGSDGKSPVTYTLNYSAPGIPGAFSFTVAGLGRLDELTADPRRLAFVAFKIRESRHYYQSGGGYEARRAVDAAEAEYGRAHANYEAQIHRFTLTKADPEAVAPRLDELLAHCEQKLTAMRDAIAAQHRLTEATTAAIGAQPPQPDDFPGWYSFVSGQ